MTSQDIINGVKTLPNSDQHATVHSAMDAIGMSWIHTIPLPLAITMAIAGLGVFLFAIRIMSNSLKTMTSGYTVKLLKKFGAKPLLGLLFGFIFTSIIQSSGGAVALAIGLLGAGMMNMRGAIAFLLGANIGTSTTSLLVWLSSSASFTQYFMLFAFIGVMILMLVKEEKKANIGTLIASFGMIFIGLKMLGWGMDRVGDTQTFQTVFDSVAVNPWSGLFASIGLTGLMQSSSASITIVQHMYEAHAANGDAAFLPAAIAMILGANIGTTFIAFLISIGGNKDARRIALIWLITNASFALIFMFLVYPWDGYAWLVQQMTSQPVGQLAMAHLFFNIILSCSFIWFVKQLNWLAYKMVPDTRTKFPYKTELSVELIYASPNIAFQSAKRVTKELAIMTRDTQTLMIDYLDNKDPEDYKKIKELLELIDITRSNLYSYLVEIGSTNLTKADANKHMSLVLASRSLERIPVLGKQVFHDLNQCLDKKTGKFRIQAESWTELRTLNKLILSITKRLPKMITRYNKESAKEIFALEEQVEQLVEAFSQNFVSRSKGMNTEFDYLLALKTIQRMAGHGRRVVKYISKGRKDVKFVELPDKLVKEIVADF